MFVNVDRSETAGIENSRQIIHRRQAEVTQRVETWPLGSQHTSRPGQLFLRGSSQASPRTSPRPACPKASQLLADLGTKC